jgi:hypothetical protein
MTRLNKKSDRLQLLEYKFKSLIEKGYTQETHKDLNIFTRTEQEGKKYDLIIYSGTSTNPICNYYYTKEENRTKKISDCKANADNREQRKTDNAGKRTLTGSALCAAAVREELKKAFEYCKFSVTSDNFANGNAVRISWTNGPTEAQIDEITSKYQYGHFNGMDDIYEFSNNIEGLPQAKFVSTSRTVSEDLISRLEIDFKNFYDNADANDYDHWSIKNVVRRMLYKNEIVNADNIKGFKVIKDSGSLEDCYGFLLVNEQTEATQTNIKPIESNANEVNIIDYSEKAIAVIGDTKPIKDLLKSLGGSFNPRLSCGCGWIFSKKKLEEVQTALINYASNKADTNEILALPAHEENETLLHPNLEPLHPLNICDPESSQYKEAVKEYSNINDITEAAESGIVVSLLNMYNLVNQKTINV